MSSATQPILSTTTLFTEREARLRKEKEAEEHLRQQAAEELADYKRRLDTFQMTEAHREIVVNRIRRAFERGETELMLVSFPSSFCSDGGRAVNNADLPPINKPDKEEEAAALREPAWLATLPGGARQVYDFWKASLEPGGFAFSARIVSYQAGVPGEVGLFFSWPKSALDSAAPGD
ncbi:conserved protein of unknown function [Rhodovastum atsumiense]|uniref:Uncharacterized protein n=1 Tax=Rhodovastum atsumiense TaxID=504468 RepID=A0A5M6INR3_9PROT|nr:hypothetical protein [Rhodovastum atsumiense]KAA5609198.1 hypothetical protein F1189_25200 [Rhodovastum atsumiense]CAH2603977.1 conserved protein of unknown function [Rhodovastum atsumiense]